MSGRFSIAMHILTLLAKSNELLSSEYIAGSININPVLVRKELSNLRKHGFIESKEGKNGGSALSKSPKQIKLSDVFRTVMHTSVLGKMQESPNPKCPVGSQINNQLDFLYKEAEEAMLKKLDKITLADFSNRFE